MEDTRVITKLREFCVRENTSTSGVFCITIQISRSTDFCSLVVDFDTHKILENYPSEIPSYSEKRKGDLLICYKGGLQPSTSSSSVPDTTTVLGSNPFGCDASDLSTYKSRSTAKDGCFADFIRGTGNYPDLVFEIKKQVDNGPLISTKFFTLLDSKIQEVEGPFSQKVHCFKNYKCPKQNLFFGVDLYRRDGKGGYNFHHMRLNPFTKVNEDILKKFLDE